MCVERLRELQSQVWQPDGRLYLVCGVTRSVAQALNCQVKWVTHRGSHWGIYISVWQADGPCPLDWPNSHRRLIVITRHYLSDTNLKQYQDKTFSILLQENLPNLPNMKSDICSWHLASVLKFWRSSVSFFNPRTFCPADTLVDPMTVKLVRMLMKPSLFGCWC